MSVIRTLRSQRGIFNALVGGIMLGVHGLGTNLLARTISPWIICFFFTICHLVVIPWINWELNNKYTLTNIFMIFIAGLFGTLHLCFISFAFAFTSVGNTSAILYTKPLFSALFGKCLIKEPLAWIDALLILANFIGVLLVGKPPFLFGGKLTSDSRELVGAMLSLVGAICGALQYVSIRKIVADDVFDTATILLAKTVAGFLIYSMGIVFNITELKPLETTLEWFYLSIVCVCGLTEVLFTYFALETLNAKTVALITAIDVLTSYLLQIAFTSDKVDWMAIAGALLITSAPVVYGIMGIREQILQDRENKGQELQDRDGDEHLSAK